MTQLNTIWLLSLQIYIIKKLYTNGSIFFSADTSQIFKIKIKDKDIV
jgi:hypothetical protein